MSLKFNNNIKISGNEVYQTSDSYYLDTESLDFEGKEYIDVKVQYQLFNDIRLLELRIYDKPEFLYKPIIEREYSDNEYFVTDLEEVMRLD